MRDTRTGLVVATGIVAMALAACATTTAGTPVAAPELTIVGPTTSAAPPTTAVPTTTPVATVPTAAPEPTACTLTLTVGDTGAELRTRGESGGFQLTNDMGALLVGCLGRPAVGVRIRPSAALVVRADGRNTEIRAGATAQAGPYRITALRVDADSADFDMVPV